MFLADMNLYIRVSSAMSASIAMLVASLGLGACYGVFIKADW